MPSVENASSLCRHKNSSLQGYIPDEQFGFQLYAYTDCTLHIRLYGVQSTLKTYERSSSLIVKSLPDEPSGILTDRED